MNSTRRILIGGLAICVIVSAWLLWPRGASDKVRETTWQDAPTAAPSAMTKGDEQPTTSPASPKSSMPVKTQTSSTPDLEQKHLQRELERLANTQQYRDMMARQQRGEQMTKEDWELLAKATDIKGKMIKEPHLVKSTTYPPKDAKTQEMWEWWRKMRDADPRFEYKRAIEFYGRVVDDFGNAISNALIAISIAGPDGDREIFVKSNTQGLFSIKNQKGKFLTVEIDKHGYGRDSRSFGTFEFAEFFSENFHEPDPNNPVVFVLPRLNP